MYRNSNANLKDRLQLFQVINRVYRNSVFNILTSHTIRQQKIERTQLKRNGVNRGIGMVFKGMFVRIIEQKAALIGTTE